MCPVANLVHESTTDIGTGSLSLSSLPGLRKFSDEFSTSDTFNYFISHRSAPEWEIGEGSIDSSGNLQRDTVISSSNANNIVDLSSGTKDVINDALSSTLNTLRKSYKLQDLGSISGTGTGSVDIDVSKGTQVIATLTGDTEFTFSGSPDSGDVTDFDLRLTDADQYAITWPSGTLFAGSTAPDIIGSLCELPCQIDANGVVTVYGVIDDIG